MRAMPLLSMIASELCDVRELVEAAVQGQLGHQRQIGRNKSPQ